MALHEISFDAQGPITDVAFNKDGSLIGVLHADSVSIVEYDPRSRDSRPEIRRSILFEQDQDMPCQIASVGETEFQCLVHHDDRNTDSVQAVRNVQATAEGAHPVFLAEEVPPRISSVFSRMDRTAVHYTTTEGFATQTNGIASFSFIDSRSLRPWVEIAGGGEAVSGLLLVQSQTAD